MKIIIPTILVFVAVLVAYMTTPTEAVANTHTCAIKGGKHNAFVVVTDMDRAGNPMRQRGELFRGVLEPGQNQDLKSVYGRLRYSYKNDMKSRSQGQEFAYCKGNTIRLP